MRTLTVLSLAICVAAPVHAETPIPADAPVATEAVPTDATPTLGSPEPLYPLDAEESVFSDDAQAWNLELCAGSKCLRYDSVQGFSTKT